MFDFASATAVAASATLFVDHHSALTQNLFYGLLNNGRKSVQMNKK